MHSTCRLRSRNSLLSRSASRGSAQITLSPSFKLSTSDVVRGEVQRYELPRLGALNFVMGNALGGGVTRSLALDAHGKSLSSALLDLEVPDIEQ